MLTQMPTDKDIQNYYESKIWGELFMPFTWTSHQFCLFMLEGIRDITKKLDLRKRIFDRFSSGTNAHNTLEEK